MALTATATQGFEFAGYVEDTEVLYVPGTAGTTYNRGDQVAMSAGIAVTAGGDTAPTAIVKDTVACPANTQAFRTPFEFQPGGQEAADNCLVGIRPMVPAGTPKYLVSFANHQDETVVTYSAGSRYIECTTGFGADDRPNGALLYVYEGPGAGEVNVVTDYDHTGGAVELLLNVARPFNATLTSASKFIVLSSAAAANAVGQLDRADSVGSGTEKLDVADGVNDGNFVVFFSWERAAGLLSELKLIAIPAVAFV